MFDDKFQGTVYDGETITGALDGFTITATIHSDDTSDTPWDRDDGHGPVSGWREFSTKRAGELTLNRDGSSARFYDYSEACKIARLDGWGSAGDDGMKARAKAARAAMQDYKTLRAWCNDEWQYVGVAVTVSRADVDLVDQFEHALWGIESNAPDYLTEVAEELVSEAIETARAKLAELTA